MSAPVHCALSRGSRLRYFLSKARPIELSSAGWSHSRATNSSSFFWPNRGGRVRQILSRVRIFLGTECVGQVKPRKGPPLRGVCCQYNGRRRRRRRRRQKGQLRGRVNCIRHAFSIFTLLQKVWIDLCHLIDSLAEVHRFFLSLSSA